ncbi:MAG TPA: hypothetical protein VK425_03450, partial [Acidimicrobiales bacterium]|nr:hypothetical protein [Acidimicrobiales bacterium]
MPAGAKVPHPAGEASAVHVRLLGRFSVTLGEREAGPWPRPSAKRICELVLVSPGHRIGREHACELLFGNLGPAEASNALSRALSLARSTLSALGEEVVHLLSADRTQVWVPPELPLAVDLVAHGSALRAALEATPGPERDQLLVEALQEERVLLEDEPYSDWAIGPREALESLRQRARFELARDRSRGRGSARPEAVAEAWEKCLAHDPASEEATSALM